MKGRYRITIQNKRIKYDFELKRNITIIRGDSATGKTALVDMIREYYENGADSGIELKCEKICTVLEGRNWAAQLSLLKDSIIFIDEGNAFAVSKEFAAAIQHTDNYYVIVTRESLATLPYSVNEIYGIRNSGKYGYLKQTYNEFYNIYNTENLPKNFEPDMVITEDSNSGFQFFSAVCRKNGLECLTSEGKSNVFQYIRKCQKGNVLIVADGAAFGPEMDKVMKQIEVQGNATLYLPESFEWLILQAEIVKDSNVSQILNNPSEYIDAMDFFSWERFFTHLLTEKTKDTYLKYTKSILNPIYVQEGIEQKILDKIEKIDFKWKNR